MRLPKLVSMGCFMVLSLLCSGLYLKTDWVHYQQMQQRWQTLKHSQRPLAAARPQKKTFALPFATGIAFLTQSLNAAPLALHRIVMLNHSLYDLEITGPYAAYLNWFKWADGAAYLVRYDIKRVGAELKAVMVLQFYGMPSTQMESRMWLDPFHLQISATKSPPLLSLFPIQALHLVGFAGVNAIWQLPSGTLQTAEPSALLGQEACESQRLDRAKIRLTCASSHTVLIKEVI